MQLKSEKKTKEELELNQELIPLPVFLASYNSNIPEGFPLASTRTLRKFQELHPGLFRNGDNWSVAKHRKRLIDWFASNPELL